MRSKKVYFDLEKTSVKLLALIIVAIISVPIIFTVLNSFSASSSFMSLIVNEGILFRYLITTIELIAKVGFFAAVIGFIGAYINVFYEYPLKRLINTLFILPLSIPIYVGAYTYTEIYHDFGVLEWLFKNEFTLNGSVFIYVIFLYPYVYLGVRSYLRNNMGEYIESAKVLGISGVKLLKRIVIPLARPVIVASSLLVIFETLSDFAVLKYYGVETISKLINDSWFLLGEKGTAAKLALMLLVIIVVLVAFEKIVRGKRRNDSSLSSKLKLTTPSSKKMTAFYLFFSSVITLGFLLPGYNVFRWAIKYREYFFKDGFLDSVINTLQVTVLVIVIVISVALLLSSVLRLFSKKVSNLIYSIGSVGYSIPSIVLSLGVYVVFLKLDTKIYPFTSKLGIDSLFFTGTILALVFALSMKFMSIAFSQFSAQHQKFDKSLFEASHVLGKGFIKTFLTVDLPLLKTSLKAVSILLFIDVLKELTITYSLRPFNFNTLSTEVYRYAGNEMLGVSAVPGSVIIVLSVVMIIFLEGRNKNVRTKKSKL